MESDTQVFESHRAALLALAIADVGRASSVISKARRRSRSDCRGCSPIADGASRLGQDVA
jgi:hypothetical protein